MMIKEIGVVRRNGLGDLLCVMPLISLCRERFEGCRITLFVDARGAQLARYLAVDDVVVIPTDGNKYLALLKTVWGQRHRSFDLLISAKPSPMKLLNLFLYGLRGRERVACVDGAWHSRLINTPRHYIPNEERHQAVKSLRLLDPTIEQVPAAWKPRLSVEPGYHFVGPTLLISLSNNRIGSRLDNDKIARLINRMTNRFEIVINCEPQDIGCATDLAQRLQRPCRLIPTTSFDDFLRLLASVSCCFSGDGGVMHLAAALDKPQVVLFGGTKVWEWAPMSDRAITLSDPHNVNFIPEEKIYNALEQLWFTETIPIFHR